MEQLVKQLQTGVQPLISFADIINTTQTTLAALHSLRENRWVDVASIGMTEKPSTLAGSA